MLEFFQEYSYIGLFAILLIEEGGIPLPIPGDIFIAAVATIPNSNYLLIVSTVVLSTLIGSTILFTISKKFGRHLLVKYGKYIRIPFLRIRITPDKIKRIEKWFEKYGGFAIVIGRLIPGLRIVTPVTAGLFKVSYKSFWIYTSLAALIWANIYFLIGKFFSEIISRLI